MRHLSTSLALMAGWLALVGVGSSLHATSPHMQRASSAPPAAVSSERALLDRYCITCHNENLRAKGTVPVSLQGLDLSRVSAHAEVWEKVVRKVRGGVMPPAGMPRPDKAALGAFAGWFEAELDRAAAAAPNPGRTEAMHRLNRAEYRHATRDLLDIDVDVEALLPIDDSSYGFDNMAGVLRFSPTLMERYLNAAKKVSRLAVGTPPASPDFDVFRLADDFRQDDRLDGLPLGTRGGTRIRYHFPVDGDYEIRVKLARQTGVNDHDIPRFSQPQQFEVGVDGERAQLFTLAASVPPARPEEPPNGALRARERGQQRPPQAPPAPREDRSALDADWKVRIPVKAGPRDVTVTSVTQAPALLETWVEPYHKPHSSGGGNMWSTRKGAYVGSVEISGPFTVTGPGDTPSRRRIFTCRPAGPADEARCAKRILLTLARRAYRRPVTDGNVQELLKFYNEGRKEGGFDAGIELALRRLLVSPEFLFRTVTDPPGVAPGANYRISDVDLASRLSFFLWSSIPDDELLNVATQGRLRDPDILDRQVRRLIADDRSQGLVDNFVGQWLYLRNVGTLSPDAYKDPDFDENLRRALRRETELFFTHIMREDRSVVELLSANYTFLNERLARHYGIPGVYGDHFRRVMLPEGSVRGGLLGQGSILSVTSHPNRTSPVLRGKWILENILGTPPPAPPANVPPLPEKQGGGKALTMRERMAEHRSNPVCASCHSMMDPPGLGLENFDHAGRWRTVEEAFDPRMASFSRMDVNGTLPDGTKFEGAAGLRKALLSRSENFVTTMTEKLLMYALGRGVDYYDMPAVRAIVRDASRQEYRFSALVLGVAKSIPFQMRRSGGPSNAPTTSAVARR